MSYEITKSKLTLSGIEVTFTDGASEVVIAVTNAEAAKAKDIRKLAGDKLVERLVVLSAADMLRGS